MNKTQIENAILKELYKCWVDESEAPIDSLLPDLDAVSKKDLSLALDDLNEAGLIDNTSFGGFYSLTTNGVIQTEDRGLVSDEVVNENTKARSVIVQRAFDVRENEGRDADVNIDDVISDFELSERSAFRNARLMSELGWIEFRTARLYVVTPYGRNEFRAQLEAEQSPKNAKKKQIIFETSSDSYQVIGTLGQGGVGMVYEVLDSNGKSFALKIISETVLSREKVKRFHNELQFLFRNVHPNLVEVVDEGFVLRDQLKVPFYVMPKYDSTLRSLINNGIPTEKIVSYFGDLLSGIELLHSKDIYHRDLKPENILYDATADRLLVADLGAAHFAEEELHTLVATKPGDRLANFQYAAPEQREKGKAVTHLADLFAIGAILNEMFTKSIPVGEEYPKIGEIYPDFSSLDYVVTRLIKHNPKNRYQSVAEIREALAEISTNNYRDSPEPNAVADLSTVTVVHEGLPKTAFQKSLDEIDQFRGEQAFQQQKINFFRSQEGADATFAAFANLLAIAEKRVSILRQKDTSFQIEASANQRAFIIKSSGFSVSFAVEVNYTSSGTEFPLFDKRWKGLLSFNPNTFYFDSEWKPKIIKEVIYTSDIDAALRLCWLGPKKTNQHYSEELLDESISWLVNQAITQRRKVQY